MHGYQSRRFKIFQIFGKIKNTYNQVDDIEKDYYDVIVISSPSPHHTDQLFKVLDLKPKVILVEKPLTLTELDYKKIQKLPKKEYLCELFEKLGSQSARTKKTNY